MLLVRPQGRDKTNEFQGTLNSFFELEIHNNNVTIFVPRQRILWHGYPSSGELRNGALQIWRGVVCFSGDFTFRINILNSICTPHKHSFFIITNVLTVSRDLSHPFLAVYFNPKLHHFINNTCNSIHFLSMTIDTKFMELIGVFLNYLRFVNYNISC